MNKIYSFYLYVDEPEIILYLINFCIRKENNKMKRVIYLLIYTVVLSSTLFWILTFTVNKNIYRKYNYKYVFESTMEYFHDTNIPTHAKTFRTVISPRTQKIQNTGRIKTLNKSNSSLAKEWNINADTYPSFDRLEDLPYKQVVVVRTLAYYDDRPLIDHTPCLRFYFIFWKGAPNSFWRSLKYE